MSDCAVRPVGAMEPGAGTRTDTGPLWSGTTIPPAAARSARGRSADNGQTLPAGQDCRPSATKSHSRSSFVRSRTVPACLTAPTEGTDVALGGPGPVKQAWPNGGDTSASSFPGGLRRRSRHFDHPPTASRHPSDDGSIGSLRQLYAAVVPPFPRPALACLAVALTAAALDACSAVFRSSRAHTGSEAIWILPMW